MYTNQSIIWQTNNPTATGKLTATQRKLAYATGRVMATHNLALTYPTPTQWRAYNATHPNLPTPPNPTLGGYTHMVGCIAGYTVIRQPYVGGGYIAARFTATGKHSLWVAAPTLAQLQYAIAQRIAYNAIMRSGNLAGWQIGYAIGGSNNPTYPTPQGWGCVG